MPDADTSKDADMEDLRGCGEDEPPLGYNNAPWLHGTLAQQHGEDKPSPADKHLYSQPIPTARACEEEGTEDLNSHNEPEGPTREGTRGRRANTRSQRRKKEQGGHTHQLGTVCG